MFKKPKKLYNASPKSNFLLRSCLSLVQQSQRKVSMIDDWANIVQDEALLLLLLLLLC